MSTPYTAALLEHFRRPRNHGSLDQPDASHEVLSPVCGDRIRMELAVGDGVIADVGFRGDACAICIASASLLTDSLRAMRLEVAGRIREREVLAALQAPVPDSRIQCALLPLEALRGCLRSLSPASEAGGTAASDPGPPA